MSTTLKQLVEDVQKTFAELDDWRAVGRVYGITCGMAFRLANEEGYEPKSPDIRHRLGLPAMIPVSACPVCGGVHIKARCDAGRVRRCDPEFMICGEVI